MTFRTIDSPQNPAVKSTAKLRSSRGRQRAGKIIIDGEREIRRAIASGIQLDELFLPVYGSVDDWNAAAKTTYVVSERAHQKIAFGQRLEPVGVANRPSTTIDQLASLDLLASATFVVLEAIEKPGNIGAICRSADGAGIDAILLVEPLTDPFNPNAIRASLGTIFSVPIVNLSFDEYVAWVDQNQIHTYLAMCAPDAAVYTEEKMTATSAIVLGNEANGLSLKWESLDRASKIMLPMQGIADSLNVSAAATVLMYYAKFQGENRQ